jgi:hypothetical protein
MKRKRGVAYENIDWSDRYGAICAYIDYTDGCYVSTGWLRDTCALCGVEDAVPFLIRRTVDKNKLPRPRRWCEECIVLYGFPPGLGPGSWTPLCQVCRVEEKHEDADEAHSLWTCRAVACRSKWRNRFLLAAGCALRYTPLTKDVRRLVFQMLVADSPRPV